MVVVVEKNGVEGNNVVKLKLFIKMEHYNSFKLLVENYKILPYPGRIFEHKIISNKSESSEYWVISSKEEKDEVLIETASGLIPESLIKYDVSDYLSVDTFQDIIDNLLDNNPQISINDTEAVNEAINHYLEYDDFLY